MSNLNLSDTFAIGFMCIFTIKISQFKIPLSFLALNTVVYILYIVYKSLKVHVEVIFIL